MATFPYIPSRIFGPVNDSSLYLIFQSSAAELVALNASKTFNAANLPTASLSSALPFLSNGSNEAYTPALDEQGNILVYAGNCNNVSASTSTLWKYETSDVTSHGSGTWVQLALNDDASTSKIKLKHANYLASGVAFSATTNSTPELYIFGGMCPDQAYSDSTEWTKSAEYSNDMLTFQPQASSAKSDFLLGLSPSRGPPIAEAGYSITGLQPTSSQSSNGNATQQRNQNFVLLGGHTKSAFINMSQVALFSLPEQSWSFLPVEQPTISPKTGLAARAATAVDPRSGHTAVLTSDGQRVVVFGGWVGDIQTAADPQLAILDLGDGYGGDGSWQWSIPDQSGVGPVDGEGIYGHGAVMLPGNVMMITGGYTLSAPTTKKSKRAGPSANEKSYFFNATSSTWTDSYSPPIIAPSQSKGPTADNRGVTASKRAGLGAGLTFGILALLALVIVYFWYSRRLKQRREAHERELRNLGTDAHSAHLPPFGAGSNGQEMASNDAHATTRKHNTDAERTGLLFEIPSPTRGLRRSLHSRGAYQPAPRYDDSRLVRGPNTIHPIDERDEYEEGKTERDTSLEPDHRQHRDGDILRSAPILDPFRDPDLFRTPSPQSPARERQLEVENWVSDWTAADALMHHRHGRVSPDKTDRTSSSLSDQSAHSAVSAQSWQYSAGSVNRSMSQRSTALFTTRPFSPPLDGNSQLQASNFQHSHSMTRKPGSSNRRSQSLTLLANPRGTNTSDIYATATTPSSQLQSEGEALLGGYPGQEAASPTRMQSRARGWMGSVRRVFTGVDRNTSESPNNPSASSSPIKYHHTEAGVPRRAASAGAALWQKRQGAKDWNVGGTSGRGDDGEANGPEAGDEEWDVESAVERRVVQVMFTVPKEKLRVVNRGPDGDGVSMVSREGSVQETEKQKKEKGKEKAKEED
ncbi:MAG: hypothetical protein Q9191_002643 [Dirinaria sp. TL-2023a]